MSELVIVHMLVPAEVIHQLPAHARSAYDVRAAELRTLMAALGEDGENRTRSDALGDTFEANGEVGPGGADAIEACASGLAECARCTVKLSLYVDGDTCDKWVGPESAAKYEAEVIADIAARIRSLGAHGVRALMCQLRIGDMARVHVADADVKGMLLQFQAGTFRDRLAALVEVGTSRQVRALYLAFNREAG